MGLSDMPPPTILCLKRSRSEDPSSLTELCVPLPKQACLASPAHQSSHHLSLLADLESSLDAPAVEAPTPEELVMEMMKSLEKVMGDIGELVSVSGMGTLCVEAPDTIANSPQKHDLTRDIASDYAESKLVDASSQTTPCVGTTNTIANSLQMSDSIRDVRSVECDVVSELDSYARDGPDACGVGCCDVVKDNDLCPWDERYVEEDGYHDSGHVGLDDMQHLLDMSDDDLGISVAEAAMHASAGQPRDEQWTLLDDFAAMGACNDGLIDGGATFLEEGYEFPSFTPSQDEEGMLARAREQGTLDCYL